MYLGKEVVVVSVGLFDVILIGFGIRLVVGLFVSVFVEEWVVVEEAR